MTLLYLFSVCWVLFLLIVGIKLFNKDFKKISIRQFIKRCAFNSTNTLKIYLSKSDIVIKISSDIQNTFNKWRSINGNKQ